MKLMKLITEDKIIQGKDYKISGFADKASGTKAIVPTQGIVFTYKGNIYKATGLFSDINQILGAFKYAR